MKQQFPIVNIGQAERDRRFWYCFSLVKTAAFVGGWKMKGMYHSSDGRSTYTTWVHPYRAKLTVRFSDHAGHPRQREKQWCSVRLDNGGAGWGNFIPVLFRLSRLSVHRGASAENQVAGGRVFGVC